MFQDFWYVAPPWLLNFLAVLVWGPIGGLFVAVVLFRFARWFPATKSQLGERYIPLSIDAINMAHLRVTGGAGLALVSVCASVAVYVPFIGIALAAGFGIGLIAAMVLIRKRRKTGPVSSSSQALGAAIMLRLDQGNGVRGAPRRVKRVPFRRPARS